MLFLVISEPRADRPSEMAKARQDFWPWMAGHQASGVCLHIYPRVGRGVVVVFKVDNNEQLHRILNEWADIIPAQFDIYPLVNLQATTALLASQVAATAT